MRNDVISLVQEIYFEEEAARTVLLKIGVPPSRIPVFRSAETFWPEMILKLENGIVMDGVRKLLSAAIEAFPGRRTEIERLLGGRAGPPRVLGLFADPPGPGASGRLRLDQEARILREIADRGGIDLIDRHAVRPEDVIYALFNDKPDILHFAGHGGRNGLMLLENERGRGTPVKATDVAKAVRGTSRILDCVVLNSCFTADNAAEFRGATHAVAGSTSRLPDDCALSFARGFYTAIAAGSIAENAFNAAVAAMDMRLCDSKGMCFQSFTQDSAA
jgi:hypothetical protein